MTLSRREFLATTSAISLGATAPGLFHQMAMAAPKADQPGGKDTILVVVQLSGGNDGLNTVIPFRDDEYIKARPTLKQGKNQVKKINKDLGFHSSMDGFAELLEDQELAIIQGVGYPNPDRSHFSSMDIWHRASRDEKQPYGWLGRAVPMMKGHKNAMYIGGGEGPLAMFGAKGHAPALTDLNDYQMKVSDQGDNLMKRKVIENLAETKPKPGNDLLNLVRNSAKETYESSKRLRDVANNYTTSVDYPLNGLGQRMNLIAQLIDAEVPDRVFYTQLGGFDTHAGQEDDHARLMDELSSSLNVFQKDLKEHGHDKRVLVMTFSEFGRRIKENGSKGTDHGSGSQMFLIGSHVKAGVHGKHPDLSKPLNGDVRFHTDFRQIYATVLEQWLDISPKPILEKDYKQLDVLKK